MFTAVIDKVLSFIDYTKIDQSYVEITSAQQLEKLKINKSPDVNDICQPYSIMRSAHRLHGIMPRIGSSEQAV